MKFSRKTQAIASGAEPALFVAIGLLPTEGANNPAATVQPTLIKDPAVSHAEQSGKAFAMVAAHVKPAAVSVHLRKNGDIRGAGLSIFIRR